MTLPSLCSSQTPTKPSSYNGPTMAASPSNNISCLTIDYDHDDPTIPLSMLVLILTPNLQCLISFYMKIIIMSYSQICASEK